MSENPNKKATAKAKENLKKIVDVVENNLPSSSENCEKVCKDLKGKNRTESEQKEWEDCGCL